MKRFIGLLLCLFLLLSSSACQSGQAKLYDELTARSSGAEEPEAGLSGELHIFVDQDDRYTGLHLWADEFMRLHPDVKIEIEAGAGDLNDLNQPGAVDAFAQKLSTMLLSGEAPDIVDVSSYADPGQYAASGVVYDLYELMDADPDFHREDYYENIFKAMEFRGGLYTMPINFSLDVVFLNGKITDALGLHFEPWDKVDYEEILDTYDKAQAQGLLAEDFTLLHMDARGRELIFGNTEMPDYVDIEERTACFDSPEFITYLERTKQIPANRKTSTDGLIMMTGIGFQDFLAANAQENVSLMTMQSVTLGSAMDALENVPDGVVGPLVLVSKQGTQPFLPYNGLTIPKGGENTELAWEFLKFCVAPVDTPSYHAIYQPEGAVDIAQGFLPIAKENLRQYAMLYSAAEALPSLSTWPADFDLETAERATGDELLGRIEEAVSGVNSTTAVFERLNSLLSPTLWEFYEADTMNAQQCAKKLQDKATIYLRE